MKMKEDLKATQELNRRLDALAKDKEEKLAIEEALVTNLKVKLDDANLRRVAVEVEVRKSELEVEAAQHALT